MTQRHGIYSVPLPISGKKVAANVVTLAAWRSGRDSNPRADVYKRQSVSSVTSAPSSAPTLPSVPVSYTHLSHGQAPG